MQIEEVQNRFREPIVLKEVLPISTRDSRQYCLRAYWKPVLGRVIASDMFDVYFRLEGLCYIYFESD